MNKSKKIELASLLLSEDKEIRILAINYIRSICKKNITVRCSWDFDIDGFYKIISIVNIHESYGNILTLLLSVREHPENFTIQAILDLINLIIENNEIKNEN